MRLKIRDQVCEFELRSGVERDLPTCRPLRCCQHYKSTKKLCQTILPRCVLSSASILASSLYSIVSKAKFLKFVCIEYGFFQQFTPNVNSFKPFLSIYVSLQNKIPTQFTLKWVRNTDTVATADKGQDGVSSNKMAAVGRSVSVTRRCKQTAPTAKLKRT